MKKEDQIEKLKRENIKLKKVIEEFETLFGFADFKNGITSEDGTIDEGEVLAYSYYERNILNPNREIIDQLDKTYSEYVDVIRKLYSLIDLSKNRMNDRFVSHEKARVRKKVHDLFGRWVI